MKKIFHHKGGLYFLRVIAFLCLPFLLLACSAPVTPPASPSTSPALSPAPVPTKPASPTTSLSPSPAPAPLAKAPPGYIEPSVVDSSDVTFTSETFTIKAYHSRPKSGSNFPGLIIIHENRGLTDHIKDVARRYANQGYAVIAPDLLSRIGGTAQFATTDEAVAAIGTLKSDGVIQDLNAAFKYLQPLAYVKKDSIGVLGYCWGGGNSLLFSIRNRDLKAVVVYYGPNPANIDDVANINAPILGNYGANDPRITVNVPVLEEAMKKYNKTYDFKIYPGALHAFNNDTGANYNAEAAADAWQRTLAFLQKYLKSG